MKKPASKNNSGFSLIEMVVACAIIIFSIFSVLALARKSNQLARRAIDETSASFILEEGAEAVKIVRDNAWPLLTGAGTAISSGATYYPTFSGGTWTLSITTATVGIFTRTVVFSDVYRDSSDNIASSGTLDSGTKKVTVGISWPEFGTTISKSLSFYVTDI